jgi:hypothetical protein
MGRDYIVGLEVGGLGLLFYRETMRNNRRIADCRFLIEDWDFSPQPTPRTQREMRRERGQEAWSSYEKKNEDRMR